MEILLLAQFLDICLENNTPSGWIGCCFLGASDVTRTRDLLITSEMHYRLCYTSALAYYIHFFGGCQLFSR